MYLYLQNLILLTWKIMPIRFLSPAMWSENGPRLHVEAEQTKIFSQRGDNVTLPCKFYRDHTLSSSGSHRIRVKWTKLTPDGLKPCNVYAEMGAQNKSYGNYKGRVFLKKSTENDASLVITDITLEDYGKYKCEVIEGLEDGAAIVSLDLKGKPYWYKINPLAHCFLRTMWKVLYEI